jgi:hypothetical protein
MNEGIFKKHFWKFTGRGKRKYTEGTLSHYRLEHHKSTKNAAAKQSCMHSDLQWIVIQ